MLGVTAASHRALKQAARLCADEMLAVDTCIREHLHSDVAVIPALGHYIIGSGGKRLRPLLCLLTARLFGYQGNRHIPLAVVVEFLHTASLLHDDVVDEAVLRRGTPAANGVWGNQASVLVGDFLFSRAFELMVADGSLEILRLLSEVTKTLAEGEVLQLSRTFHLAMTEAEYLEVIERKTAILFAAAAEIGARVAGQPQATMQRMREYGMCLGMAFQLMDDALDYAAEEEAVGKPVAHDLGEGKITLPLIHAMRADAELAQRVEEIAARGGYADGDGAWVRERVLARGGVEHTQTVAGRYAERAKALLPDTGEDEVRRLLADLADFSARRLF